MIQGLIGVAVIVIGIAASIALHEAGHLIPAKRFGVKVTQFMIGFDYPENDFRSLVYQAIDD